MRADRPSETAIYVAMGRALAHAHRTVKSFDDPFALQLLPEDYRAVVERRLRGGWPRSRRDAVLGLVADGTERLIGPRTVEIDDGLRAMPRGVQLVILGAGLDARAYRMRELSESVAFEVDHPASQALKIERTAGLVPRTRELRRVAVDFERERFADALVRAGHMATEPTAWIFEGVISYLAPCDVEASIDAIAAQSCAGSRLLATYNEPSLVRRLYSRTSERSGEPHRAMYTREEMQRLLGERGFVVCSDRDGYQRAQRWSASPTFFDRRWGRFHHVVIADFERNDAPLATRA